MRTSPTDDPAGPPGGSYRVFRGGGWSTRRGAAGRRTATTGLGSAAATWASASP